MEAELAPAAAEGKVVWSVTGDSKVTIDQNGLLSAAADATLNGKVTVKAAYDKDANIFGTKEITVAEKINYGTKANPLTVAEAKAVLDKTGTSESEQPLFVKGIISTNKAFSDQYHNGEVWLQSDDGSVAKAFELYRCEIDASLNYSGDPAADELVGYEVIATGYGKIYGSTYELTNVTRDDVAINPKIVSMTREEVPATAVALDKATAEVEVGKTLTLAATLTPANSTSKVTWISSDDTIATVAKGVVTGVKAGTATITAKVSDTIKAECVVTVKAAAVAYESKGSLSFNKDTTVTINNQLEDATDPKITYTSTSGVSIIVRKNTSSSAVNVWKSDYSSCRWYVGHKVTISSGTPFSKIELVCDSGYREFKAEAEGTTIAALKAAGITVEYESSAGKIILTFGSPVSSFDLVPDKQIRPSNVELFAVKA